jgi:putative transposase
MGLERAIGKIAVDIVTKATKIEMPVCKFCSSANVVRNGKRKGTQYWLCKDCGHGFVANNALPRDRYPLAVAARAVSDYYSGKSLTGIREGIKQDYGLEPADSSVYNWLRTLTAIGLSEAKKYSPKVGDRWVIDETVISLKDNRKYWLINIIDSDTRFLLAHKLSPNRSMKDIITVIRAARDKAKNDPTQIVSDGWRAYPDAVEQVFGADCKHLLGTPFEHGKLSTALIERWHGFLKDRLKPQRGMDKAETGHIQLILEGIVFYYNYLRPHEGLNGRTPAEVAKINFPYKDWLDIAKSQRPPTPTETEYHPPRPYRKRNKPKTKRRLARTKTDNIMIVRARI